MKKKSFIAYILGAFACTVIILLGFSICMAAGILFGKSPEFAAQRAAFGAPDFVSGADTFFTILLIFSYVILNGLFHRSFNENKTSRLAKHGIFFALSVLLVELVLPYSNQIEIVTEFSRLSYLFCGYAVFLQEKRLEPSDAIDRVFSLFGTSAASAAVVLALCHLFVGFPFSFFNEVKFFVLLSAAAFFCYLASFIAYTSFRTNPHA